MASTKSLSYQIITTQPGVGGGDTIQVFQQGSQLLWAYLVLEQTTNPLPLSPGYGTCAAWGSNLDLFDTAGLEATLQGFVYGQSGVNSTGVLINQSGRVFKYLVAAVDPDQSASPQPKTPDRMSFPWRRKWLVG